MRVQKHLSWSLVLNHIEAGHVSHAGEGNGRYSEGKPFKIGLTYSGCALRGLDSCGVEFVVLRGCIVVLLVRGGALFQRGRGCQPGVSYKLSALLDTRFPGFLRSCSAIGLGNQFFDDCLAARGFYARHAWWSPLVAAFDVAHDAVFCFSHDATRRSGRRFRVDTLIAHFARKRFAPGL
jgi:hypothetical protein